jgi:hypothetical protein
MGEVEVLTSRGSAVRLRATARGANVSSTTFEAVELKDEVYGPQSIWFEGVDTNEFGDTLPLGGHHRADPHRDGHDKNQSL